MGIGCISKNKIDPVDPNSAFFVTRIEGITKLLDFPSSKKQFLLYLNCINMDKKYLSMTESRKFAFLDAHYIDIKAKFILRTIENGTKLFSVRNGSVLSYLRKAKARDVIIICINTFNDFLRSDFYNTSSKGSNRMNSFASVTSHSGVSSLSHFVFADFDEELPTCTSLNSLVFVLQKINASTFICSATDGHAILYSNPSFSVLTGYSADEMLGRSLSFLHGGKAETELVEEMTISLNEGRQCQIALTTYRKDGMPFKNLISLVPIYDEDGKYIYVVGINFDVTKPGVRMAKQKLSNEFINLVPKVLLNDNYTVEDDSCYAKN